MILMTANLAINEYMSGLVPICSLSPSAPPVSVLTVTKCCRKKDLSEMYELISSSDLVRQHPHFLSKWNS